MGREICVICLNRNLIQFPSAKRSVHPNMIEGYGSMVGRMKQVIDLLESQYDWYCVRNRLRHYHIPMLSLLCKPISTFGIVQLVQTAGFLKYFHFSKMAPCITWKFDSVNAS